MSLVVSCLEAHVPFWLAEIWRSSQLEEGWIQEPQRPADPTSLQLCTVEELWLGLWITTRQSRSLSKAAKCRGCPTVHQPNFREMEEEGLVSTVRETDCSTLNSGLGTWPYAPPPAPKPRPKFMCPQPHQGLLTWVIYFRDPQEQGREFSGLTTPPHTPHPTPHTPHTPHTPAKWFGFPLQLVLIL